MNQKLLDRLSQHIDIDGGFTLDGGRVAQDELFDKYDYSEWQPWIDKLPESPVKQALLDAADTTAIV